MTKEQKQWIDDLTIDIHQVLLSLVTSESVGARLSFDLKDKAEGFLIGLQEEKQRLSNATFCAPSEGEEEGPLHAKV